MNVMDKYSLKGKTVLVTGGAGLLGRQFTKALGEAGASVLVADLDLERSEIHSAALSDLGIEAHPVYVDVTQKSSVEQMVETALEKFGHLDVLVNSAALDPKFDKEHIDQQNNNAFEDYSLEAWNQTIDVNLTGVFLSCQAAVRPMLKQGGGIIINISSIYGINGPDQSIYAGVDGKAKYKPIDYSVTKAGVVGLTKFLAAYYAGTEIRVNTLTLGGVINQHQEHFLKNYSIKTMLGRMAQLDDIDAAIVFLASDASKYMTGANLVIDGGYSAW